MTHTTAPSSRSTASLLAGLRRTVTAGSAVLLLAAIATPAEATTPGNPGGVTQTPIAGDIVTCTINGQDVSLTGVSGTKATREITHVDGKGRAHVLFTIRANQNILAAADGTRYQLVGHGYDRVLYPTKEVTGDPLNESIRYRFDVIGDSGVIGVVRFAMDSATGQQPVVKDASTCKIPHG